MLEKEMLEAAESLDFEKAARLRDRIKEIKGVPELVIQSAAKSSPKSKKKKSAAGTAKKTSR